MGPVTAGAMPASTVPTVAMQADPAEASALPDTSSSSTAATSPTRKPDDDDDDDKTLDLPLWVSTMNLFVYICGVATFFHKKEGWDATDSIYFVVTSITTVGFGDLMPSGGYQWLFSVILIFLGIAIVGNFVASIHRSLTIFTIKVIHILNQRDLMKRGFPVFPEVQRKPEPLDPAAPKRRRLNREQIDALKNDKYSLYELVGLSLYLSGKAPTCKPANPVRLIENYPDYAAIDVHMEGTNPSAPSHSSEQPESTVAPGAKHSDCVVIDVAMEGRNPSGVAPSRQPESPVAPGAKHLDYVVIDIDMEETNCSGVAPSQEPDSAVALGAERLDYTAIDIDMEETNCSGVAPSREPDIPVTPRAKRSHCVVIDVEMEGANSDTRSPVPPTPWIQNSVVIDMEGPG